MPLQLKFGGQLLVASPTAKSFQIATEMAYEESDDRFTITMAPRGQRIPARSIRVLSFSRSSSRGRPRTMLAVQLGDLPDEYQEVFRIGANLVQKRLHDNAPEYRYPRLGGLLPNRDARGRRLPSIRRRPTPIKLEKPPESVDLTSDYLVEIRPHGNLDELPYLETGKALVIAGRKPYDEVRMGFETITAFELN